MESDIYICTWIFLYINKPNLQLAFHDVGYVIANQMKRSICIHYPETFPLLVNIVLSFYNSCERTLKYSIERAKFILL
jgi:hypothetical protein